jgi:ABC-2 type transport system permease protein
MLYLLQLEWLKQKKHRTFLLLAGLYILLLPSSLLIAKSIKQWPPPINTSDTFFRFPDVFQYLGYAGNWLTFFLLGFLAVVVITQEFSSRTFRQNIINGVTRADLFLSKMYFIVLVALAAMLYFGAVCFVFGYTHTETVYSSVVMKNIDYLPRYFLMCMGYMSFGLLLGTLIRRTAAALFIYFAYVFFLEPILRWGVHYNIFKHASMQYYPMNAIEDLTPVPFAQMTQPMEKDLNFPFFLTPQQAMIAATVWIVLFLAGAFWLTSKRDL